MDKLRSYRQKIIALLEEDAAVQPANPDLTLELICDTQRDHYVIIVFGRQHGRFLYSGVIHIDIIDGKIWIQNNNSELEISKELTAMGVDPKDIVIGFHPPEMREAIAQAQQV
ncbi:MAG: XisI protein [Cyanobacteria bacterium P01_C01_bin.89]